MPKWMIGLVVAVVLTGAKMAMHAPEPMTPERRADGMATALNAIVPHRLGATTTLTGAKADGRTVEIDARLDSGVSFNLSPDDMRRMFTAVTCKERGSSDFIGQGGAVRYALTTADGSALTPVTVESCSAA